MVQINHKMVFSVQAGLLFLLGLAMLLAPQQVMGLFDMSLEQGGVGLARLYGATAIMVGVIVWAAREAGPSAARRAIVLGLLVGNVLGALVMIFNGLVGGFGTAVWVAVIVFLLLALDFGVIYFKHGEDA